MQACGLAVADLTKNCVHVHVFDSQDKLIKRLGSQGNRNGQFIIVYPIKLVMLHLTITINCIVCY